MVVPGSKHEFHPLVGRKKLKSWEIDASCHTRAREMGPSASWQMRQVRNTGGAVWSTDPPGVPGDMVEYNFGVFKGYTPRARADFKIFDFNLGDSFVNSLRTHHSKMADFGRFDENGCARPLYAPAARHTALVPTRGLPWAVRSLTCHFPYLPT